MSPRTRDTVCSMGRAALLGASLPCPSMLLRSLRSPASQQHPEHRPRSHLPTAWLLTTQSDRSPPPRRARSPRLSLQAPGSSPGPQGDRPCTGSCRDPGRSTEGSVPTAPGKDSMGSLLCCLDTAKTSWVWQSLPLVRLPWWVMCSPSSGHHNSGSEGSDQPQLSTLTVSPLPQAWAWASLWAKQSHLLPGL